MINEFNSREISTSRIVGIILTKENEINDYAEDETASTSEVVGFDKKSTTSEEIDGIPVITISVNNVTTRQLGCAKPYGQCSS